MDQRYIDLINADLDGELSAAEKAELERFLSEDPEGRRFRDELAALGEKLAQPDPLEVPADLRERIVAQIPAQKSARRGAPWWKPAGALAAGVVMAVSLGVLMEPMNLDDAGPAASGTLVKQGDLATRRIIALDVLKADLAHGWEGGTFQLTMDMDAIPEVTATLEFDEERLDIVALDAFRSEGGSVLQAGRAGRSTVAFVSNEPTAAESGELRLVFRQSGQVIHVETLTVPPAP